MEKFKNKYEIILGFVTLIVSLSAFKEDLSKVNVDLGYTTINLSTYFLSCILGFSICLYLYVSEIALRETKIGQSKFFEFQIKLAYILFLIILSSPILLLINFSIIKIANLIQNTFSDDLIGILSSIITFISSIITSYLFTKINYKHRKETYKQSLESLEIITLERAQKLCQDKYFASSIIEAFKAIEAYILKLFIEKNIRSSKNINQNLEIALKEKILNPEDINKIRNLSQMRNISAHGHTMDDFTEEQAQKAIDFVKDLIQKNNQA